MVSKKRVPLVVVAVVGLAAQLPSLGRAGQANATPTGVTKPAVTYSSGTVRGGSWALDLEKPAGEVSPAVLQDTVRVIIRRLHGLGIANATVRRQGDDILVEFPGGNDEAQVLTLISVKGQLLMRPVDCIIAPHVPSGSSAHSSPGSGPCKMSPRQQRRYLPPGGDAHGVTPAQYDNANGTVVLPLYAGFVYGRYVLGPADVSGAVIKTATAFRDPQLHNWGVNLRFTTKGATEFNKAAALHYKCYMSDVANPPYCSLQAIEMDGTVETAPAIEAPFFPGGATIIGSINDPITHQQAENLALILDYGALPVRFISQRVSSSSPIPVQSR
jgi:preprotein translocase subunit SecD